MIRKTKHGFTLVEVIVTLVVLGVVAAIAIPAYTRYIDSAQEKECAVHRGELMEKFPTYLMYEGKNEDADAYSLSNVQSYVTAMYGEDEFQCPSSHKPYGFDTRTRLITCPVHSDNSSYFLDAANKAQTAQDIFTTLPALMNDILSDAAHSTYKTNTITVGTYGEANLTKELYLADGTKTTFWAELLKRYGVDEKNVVNYDASSDRFKVYFQSTSSSIKTVDDAQIACIVYKQSGSMKTVCYPDGSIYQVKDPIANSTYQPLFARDESYLSSRVDGVNVIKVG